MQTVSYDVVLPPTGIIQNLPEDVRAALTHAGQFIEMGPKETLIKEGSAQENLYILITGQLEVTSIVTGKKVQLGKIESGGCFGEMGMLCQSVASASVSATDISVVWSMNVSQFDAFLTNSTFEAACMLVEIARTLAHRLQQANEAVRAKNVVQASLSCRTGTGHSSDKNEQDDADAGVSKYFGIFSGTQKKTGKSKISTDIKL